MMTTTATSWDELTDQAQTDLTAWFNVVDPDSEDKERLARLFGQGLFEAWDCPDCGDRVYRGDPQDWGHFQGVKQADYASYPGDSERFRPEHIARQCDDCRERCHRI